MDDSGSDVGFDDDANGTLAALEQRFPHLVGHDSPRSISSSVDLNGLSWPSM